MAIRDFGTSLLANVRERKDSQARNARKRAKKEARKDALQGLLLKGAISVGNTVLANKNDKFLQNENFYARNAKLKTNVAENNAALNSWNTSLTYEGGQDEYYNAKALAKIQTMPVAEQFKLNNPDQYNSYMHTYSSELGQIMKENAQANFEKASANVEAWGDNPEKAFKKSVLKGKPQNVTEFFTLPLVNLFSGNDERTPDQAAINSIESEKGLASQGKVDTKEVKNIYEQTNNFEFALDSAEEIKKFKDSFVAGTELLPPSTPTKGEIITINVAGSFGKMQEKSVYTLMLGDQLVGLLDVGTGKPITNAVQNSSANEAAQTVPSEIIEGIREVHREALISKANVEAFKDYKSQMLSDDSSEKEKDAFNQNYFGKTAITRKTLNAKFNSVAGWSPTFATTLAVQIGIENLNAIKDDKLGRADSFKTNNSLLTGDDQYSPVLALKALIALENKGSIPVQGAIATIKQEIADNLDYNSYTKGLSVAQENLANELIKNDINISSLFPQAPNPEEVLVAEANNTAGSPPPIKVELENLPKPPKYIPQFKGRAQEEVETPEGLQNKAYKKLEEAVDSLNNAQNLIGKAGSNYQQTERKKNVIKQQKKLDTLYASYIAIYGESN
jgi:hypothetical protein